MVPSTGQAAASFSFGWVPPGRTFLAGAIGGTFARSTGVRAYYAKPLDVTKSLDDALTASGTIRIEKTGGGGGVLLGWFNSATSFDWRTPDFLGLRLDGVKLYLEYGTKDTFSHFVGPLNHTECAFQHSGCGVGQPARCPQTGTDAGQRTDQACHSALQQE